MDVIVSVTDQAKLIALDRAAQAYNLRNSPSISGSELLQKMVLGQLEGLVAKYVKTTVTKGEFLQRFTASERVAIREAAKTNGYVQDYLELLAAHDIVHLDNPLVAQGLDMLVTASLLTQARAEEILTL